MVTRKKILEAAVILARRKRTVNVTRAQIAAFVKLKPVTVSYYISMAEIGRHLYKELAKCEQTS